MIIQQQSSEPKLQDILQSESFKHLVSDKPPEKPEELSDVEEYFDESSPSSDIKPSSGDEPIEVSSEPNRNSKLLENPPRVNTAASKKRQSAFSSQSSRKTKKLQKEVEDFLKKTDEAGYRND